MLPGRNTRKGFTMVDLLACSLMLILIGSLGIGELAASRERSNRIKCASNLSLIGKGLNLYMNENRDVYPRTRYTRGLPPTFYTNPAAANPFQADGPAVNDLTAAYFLLTRTADLPPDVFICPSTTATPDTLAAASPQSRSNFTSSANLTYSFANPYPDSAGFDAGYRLRDPLPAGFAVAADMNPGKAAGNSTTRNAVPATQPGTGIANSLNHGQNGQNVLFNDGSVLWEITPLCGIEQDNIYTSQGSVAWAPAKADDSVLLPTAEGVSWKGFEGKDDPATVKSSRARTTQPTTRPAQHRQ